MNCDATNIHYIFSIGLFNIKNIKNRKNVMLPASFLTLRDENETRASKWEIKIDAHNMEKILWDLLSKCPSIMKVLRCERPEDMKVIASRIVTPPADENLYETAIDKWLLEQGIQNMVIEVLDPIYKKRYFTLSTDGEWNLSALEMTFFTSDYYTNLYYNDCLSAIEGYLRLIFTTRNVKNYLKNARMDIRFRTRERMDQFRTFLSFDIQSIDVPMINTEYVEDESTFTKLSEIEKLRLSKLIYILYGLECCQMSYIIGNEYTTIDDLSQRLDLLYYDIGGDRYAYIILDDYEKINRCGLSEVPLAFIRKEADEKTQLPKVVSRFLGDERPHTNFDNSIPENVIMIRSRLVDVRNIWECFHVRY